MEDVSDRMTLARLKLAIKYKQKRVRATTVSGACRPAALQTKDRKFDNCVVTGDTVSCGNDNQFTVPPVTTQLSNFVFSEPLSRLLYYYHGTIIN